jgi:ribosomal protein L37AE/L43A
MKLSRITKLGMVVVGVGFLLWLVLTLWTSSGSTKSEAAAHDERHCSRCGRELPRAYWGTGQCPYCEASGRGASAPGAGKVSQTIPIVLVSLFVLLLGVHLFTVFRNRRVAVDEPSYPLFCPKCHRKLRYRHSQGGRLGQCPICKRPIAFPKPPEVRRPWHVRVWKKVVG